MISPPTISCASFGPDWKREPIADPKYELLLVASSSVFVFLLSLSLSLSLSRARACCSSRKSGVIKEEADFHLFSI